MTPIDMPAESGAMTKLTFDKKKYWIGFHPKLGYLIFDPLLQNAEWPGYVRLFSLKRNRSVSFKMELYSGPRIQDSGLSCTLS